MHPARILIIGILLGIFLCQLTFMVIGQQSGSNTVTVESEGVAGYRPIKALDDGWYLVEVEQRYVCNNPLPVGTDKMQVVIPHLVRMRASELER